jgi:hypothetical protein
MESLAPGPGIGRRPEHPTLSRLFFASMTGTAALTAWEAIEWRILGHKPVFAPERIARRLFGNRRAAPLLRFSYGPAVGILLGACEVPPLLFAIALAGVELLGLPASGATPRVRRWPRAERAMLFVHTAVFSLATAAALRQHSLIASRKALAV